MQQGFTITRAGEHQSSFSACEVALLLLVVVAHYARRARCIAQKGIGPSHPAMSTIATAGTPRSVPADATRRMQASMAKLQAANALAQTGAPKQQQKQRSDECAAAAMISSSTAGSSSEPLDRNKPMRMNNGMTYLPYQEQPKKAPIFGTAARPLSVAEVQKKLREVDAPPKPPAKLKEKQSATSGKADAVAPVRKYARTGSVKYEHTTYAQWLDSGTGNEKMVLTTFTNEQKQTRKQKQEEDKARKKMGRMERQIIADQKRVEYGFTSKEKKVSCHSTLRLSLPLLGQFCLTERAANSRHCLHA